MTMRTTGFVVAAALAVAACSSDDPGARAGEGTVTTSTRMDATSSTRQAPKAGGDPAVWNIDSNDRPTPASVSFTALVTRLGCNGGETGEVLAPSIAKEEARIVVTFTVDALPAGAHTCPGNKHVPLMVDIGEPIGQRELVDGACLSGEAVRTSFCSDGAARWSG